MAPPSYRRDIDFRFAEISYIMSRIKSGDSCSVVGVGSIGKSNLVRHLLRPETQNHHKSGISDEIKLVLLDPNCMLATIPYPHDHSMPSEWAGYEFMMHRLYKAVMPLQGFSEDQLKAFNWSYDQLLGLSTSSSIYGALRYFESVLELLLDENTAPAGTPKQLVFVFDEFEEILASLPAKFFRSLRGIRDDYKFKLTYITFTRRSLPQIIAANPSKYDALQLDPFAELFTDNTLYLGPYSETDGIAMLDALSVRQETAYSPSFRNFLMRSSGRFAGLLRASFVLARQIEMGTHESEALRFLIDQKAIKSECHTIWESLSYDERWMLKQICQNQNIALHDETARLLQDKYLLITENEAEINPPLFREYVCRFATLDDL